jgi:SP family sugar:H+ symporter-like MFS transporter
VFFAINESWTILISAQIVIGMFVAFGGVLFGYDTGTIGGILAMPYWKREFSTGYVGGSGPDVTASQTSQIVSILSAGTFFGALSAAPIADWLGRRWALIFSAGVVFNLGVILQTAATAIPMFTAGRFFAGYGVGLISALSKSSPTLFVYTCQLMSTNSSSLSIRDCT